METYDLGTTKIAAIDFEIIKILSDFHLHLITSDTFSSKK